jgi:hypothetical protein
MAGNFDWHAGQLGKIQIAILQLGHAGHMIGTFRRFDGEAAGLFFGGQKLARLERFCKVNCSNAKGRNKSACTDKSASSNFHGYFPRCLRHDGCTAFFRRKNGCLNGRY